MKNYSSSEYFKDITKTEHYFGYKDFTLDEDKKIYFLNQVHGNKVYIVDKDYDLKNQHDGDSVITTRKDFYVGVKTADCVPILLSSVESTFVCAIHAGWRGTFYEVVKETINILLKKYNCHPNDIVAAIGPSIGMSCYEVDKDLWLKFNEKFRLTKESFQLVDEKYYLNLQNINKKLLNENGVNKIDVITNCTKCDINFYSYRRDGSTENSQISIIKLN